MAQETITADEPREITVRYRGIRRKFRVVAGQLQTLLGGRWHGAFTGAMAHQARLTFGLPIVDPEDEHGHDPAKPEVVHREIRYRRARDGGIERWMPPTILHYDWGKQERLGYWRRVPPNRREFPFIREALSRVHAVVSASDGRDSPPSR